MPIYTDLFSILSYNVEKIGDLSFWLAYMFSVYFCTRWTITIIVQR